MTDDRKQEDRLADRIANLSPEKQALLAKRLQSKRAQTVAAQAIQRRDDLTTNPLSHAQRRMWFLSQWEPDSPFYNIPAVVRLQGQLDVSAIRASYREILNRHEILRARFTTASGEPVQLIDPPSTNSDPASDVPLVDLSMLLADERDQRYRELAHQEATSPFDLSKGRLLRARLVRLAQDDHILFLTFHHIISDGWSIGVFIREAALLYEAYANQAPSPLSVLPIQYADYAEWQRQQLQGDFLQEQLRYWKESLGGVDEVLELPYDRPRPNVQTFKGAYLKFSLSKSLSQALKSLAQKHDATLFMVLLAGFQVLLHRYSGQEDIRIGTPIANRNRAEVEGLIGLFVNTLVLRSLSTGDPGFNEFLSQVRSNALGAYAHQDLPLEMLLDELNVVRDMSRTPLYQVMFTLQDAPLQTMLLPRNQITILEPESGTAKFDLTLFMEDGPEGLSGAFEYNTDLFDASSIERMAGCLECLLEGVIANPQESISRLPLLSTAEQTKILYDWNATDRAYPEQLGLAQLFEEQVRRTPDAIAVAFPASRQDENTLIQDAFQEIPEDEFLTYRQLHTQASHLAKTLQDLGVGPDILVGIYMERSLAMVVATLAIIKAGGAYLPLDLSYPSDRLAFMLEDSRAPVLLTTRRYAEDFQNNLRIDIPGLRILVVDGLLSQVETSEGIDLTNQAGPENLAYVIYTSGSTGKPKGVAIPQKAISRLVFNTNYIDIGPEDRIAHASNPSFDAATFEIWGAWLHGACLVGVPREIALSTRAYSQYLKDKRIDTLFLTTALFNLMAHEAPDAFSHIKTLLFGGEQCDVNSIRLVLHGGKPQRLLHVYGPTECTTFATWYEITTVPETAVTVPIGKPLSNTQVYVLDQSLQPVPVGVPGELYLAGDGLALGYFNRPELTADKFIPNPYHPGRMYKTGDKVRFLPDGNIDFMGRFDFQVKLRGLRIELGEIEAALIQYPAIKEAVVLMREDSPGDKRLVAYLTPKSSLGSPSGDDAPAQSISIGELRQFLKDRLPDFMIPAAFVLLDRMPINPNGKIDRRALPVPDQSRPALEKAYVPPTTAVEKYLVNLWQAVLGLDRIGLYDDFFELGGDSLKAAVLMNRLQEELGGIAHVRALFMAPTVADLAMYMAEYYPQAVEKIRQQYFPEVEASAQDSTERKPLAMAVASGVTESQGIALVTPEKIDLIRNIIKPLSPRAQSVVKTLRPEKNPPAVFILSPPRSGSTLLRTMLAGNPALFSPPELDLLSFNTLAERRQAFSGKYSFWLEGVERAVMELRSVDADQARAIMKGFEDGELPTKEFYAEFQKWIAATLPGRQRLLVDKTPVYSLDLEILKRAESDFERPYYIHLVRHPFASIYSFIEAKLDGVFFRYDHPFSQRELAELVWIISHQNILDFLAGISDDRQMRITFEEMVQIPGEAMERVCEFLSIPFDVGMLKPYEGDRMTSGVRPGAQMVGDFKFYLRKDIDPKAADRWKKFFVDDTLSEQGWQIAKALGYEKPESEAIAPGAAQPAGATTRPPAEMTEIVPIPRDSDLPLSYAQQRLWFLDQWEPASPYYNVPAAVRLHGRLNHQAMQQTLNEIVRRHEVLRTRFTQVDGRPKLVIGAVEQANMPTRVIDLQQIPEFEREQEAVRLAMEEARRPFDLSSGSLIRGILIQLDKEEHLVALTMHHIVSDGWSAGVIIREIAALYSAFVEGKPSPLPDLRIQYVDFAAWQRKWFEGAVLEAQLDYWKKKLDNIPGLLELPTDRPRPAVQTLRGARRNFELPTQLFDEIKKIGQKEGTTLYMTLLAAFQALLARYSGQEDICVGTPIANRQRAEIEGLIGFFVNTLVMRANLSGGPSFRKLLAQVKQSAIEAYAAQDVPFERLVDELQPERDQSHTPLFQVMFTVQESSIQSLKLPGLTLTPVQLDTGSAKFDLILTMVDRGDVLKGVLEYNTDLFDLTTIDRMIGHYRVLLEGITKNLDQPVDSLPILTNAERRQLLVEWNQPFDPDTQPFLNQTINELFEKQVDITPHSDAVVYLDSHLTYWELNTRANQLARYLRQLGVGPNVITGLCVERSLESVVGILGILKAGGAYLPLDPEYPIDRLTFILQDAQAPVLLTQSHLVESLATELPGVALICLDQDWEKIGKESSENLSVAQESSLNAGADDLAYVIYTSGSTGRPKGVMIEHRSAINLWLGLNRVIYTQLPKTGLKVSLNAPLPFDASVQEWLMLLSGHTLVVIPSAVRQDGDSLLKFIRENRIDVLDCVPSQLKMLIVAGFFEPGQWMPQAVLPGGEAIDSGTWEKLASADQTEFFNMYGPTECTVDSTICQVSTHPLLPSIGKPIVNAQAYVLDRNLQLAPIGVAGELYLGGQGVARGYLNRPELTAERFIPNPFGQEIGPEYRGERLYRTGDLVRYLPDGYLEYLGRVDFQVKLRGFRIELGEIESVLGQLSGVQDAVVVIREDTPGEKQLVAYLVAESEADTVALNVSAIRNSLKARLPEYMVPGVFVFLDELPLTPNRKVDRKALPKPEGIRPELEVLFEAPRTEQEKTLAQIWSQVLKLDRIGIHDNFFDLGGDSILSIQVVARANQAGLRLTPRQIFEAQTIEALAAVAGKVPVFQAEQGPVTGLVALTPIQIAFFDQINAQKIAGLPANPHHWNQAILLEVRRPLQIDALRDALRHLQVHHDALRMRYIQENGAWQQVNLDLEVSEIPLTKFDLSQVPSSELDETIRTSASEEQGSLDLANGPLMRVAYFDLGFGNPGRLLIVIHHLVIDGISWRILLQDLLAAYAQASQGLPVQLPPKTTSFQRWSEQLWKYAANPEIEDQRSFWEKQVQTVEEGWLGWIPVDDPTGENLESSAASVRDALDELETEALLRAAPAAYNTEIGDILLAALVRAYRSWLSRDLQQGVGRQLERNWKGSSTTGLLVAMEGHGREDIFEGIDVTRTVGWFTSLYPVALTIGPENNLGQDLMGIKEQLRQVPQKGLGYGLLRYRKNEKHAMGDLLRSMPEPQVSFNYLGQVSLSEMAHPEPAGLGASGNLEQENALFTALEASKTTDLSGPAHDPTGRRTYLIDLVASVTQGRLRVELVYSQAVHAETTIRRFCDDFMAEIRGLIQHCVSGQSFGYTPSDFPDAELSQEEIEELMEELLDGDSLEGEE